MSIAVVGTDTEVGKTVVSAMIMARYGPRLPLAYWKPIATGRTEGRDVDAVRRWTGHCGLVHDERYLFDPPVSPHLAARRARVTIDLAAVTAARRRLRRLHPERHLIVEGIGGVLVPLDGAGTLLVDLVARMKLPCVVVARSTLGTINHTLLTLEALRRRRVTVAGVVLNGPPNKENREAVRRFGDVPIVGEVRPLRSLTRRAIAAAATRLDRRAVLKPFLT